MYPNILHRHVVTENKNGSRLEQYLTKARKEIGLLAVPKLADTMERFLETCKPLLNPDEMKETMKQARSFAGEDGQGRKLQSMLIDKAKKYENWLADWMLSAAYLDCRNSLVGWSNPVGVYAHAHIRCDAEMVQYAANVILGALAFKQTIDDGNIEQEMMGTLLLDMQQYHKLIGTCRIPGEKRDCLQYNPDSRHIVVVCNNHFYRVDVYDADEKPISLKQLIKQLDYIVDNSKKRTKPVGILTGTNRDTWGKNYQELLKKECNVESLRNIQESLFLLCLDNQIAGMEKIDKLTLASLQTFHGGGSECNAGNRWYDKSIQFVVSRDGINGINYEHSTAEGGPLASMSDFIHEYIKYNRGEKNADANMTDAVPRTLTFKLNDALCKAIADASCEVDKYVCDLVLKVVQFDKYGKEFIKGQKLSPDSYIQIALQYAYYKLHKKPVATYESARMRQFLHGRTEGIRSCSCESVTFAKAMLNKTIDDSVKINALRCAVEAHKSYVNASLNGRGVDRHLFGLKQLALEQKIEPHKFYKSPGYIKSSTFLLKTSQVPTKCEGFMTFAPREPNSYAITYNPQPDHIILAVASLKSSDVTSNDEMVDSVVTCLLEMAELLCKNVKSNL